MHFDKPSWLDSLSFKVLLAYVVGVVMTITLVSLLIFYLVNYKSDWLAGLDVNDFTQDMSGKLIFDSHGTPTGFYDSDGELHWVFDSLRHEAGYRVLDESGHTVFASEAGDAFWLSVSTRTPVEIGKFDFEYNGELFHSATASVKHAGQTWYVQFAVSARFFSLIHQGLALPFVGGGILLFSLILLVVFGACAYVTLGCTLKPLRELSESASAISPRSLNARLLSNDIPTEITPLVESFNQVLDRLERGFRTQQDFMATAAHELKTPLALIRAQLEVLENCQGRGDLLNDVAHMTRHVQQLLLLAEVSEEQNYKLTNVNTSDVAEEVVSYLLPMARNAGVRVNVIHTSDIQWQADSSALFVLLKNLLENAIQHTPEGSDVHIKIHNSKIIVRDSGPGASDEQLEKMFERFWRGAHRRDHGAGLGLAICKEISQAHGWTLTAYRAEQGLCFELFSHI